MWCKNCGKENPDGAKFCRVCGTSLVIAQGENVCETREEKSNNAQDIARQELVVNKHKGSKKRGRLSAKKIIAISCLIIVLAAGIIFAVMFFGSTINLNKYIVINTEGYSGYGTVEASIDWNAIEEQYGNKLKFTKDAKSNYGIDDRNVSPINYLKNQVTLKINEEESLSNGDKIDFSLNVSEDTTKIVNCRIKAENGSFTVANLIEMNTFDAFSDITVEFDGIAPNGWATIICDGNTMESSDFLCDNAYGLSNGDVITVYIDKSKLDYFAEKLEMIPESLTKEYQVDNLDAYVTSLDEIDNEALQTLRKQSKDILSASIASAYWKRYEWDSVDIKDFTYVGNYLLTIKNTDSVDDRNMLYQVYKIQLEDVTEEPYSEGLGVFEFYWYSCFSNLIISDGEVETDLEYYSTPTDRVSVDYDYTDRYGDTTRLAYWKFYGYDSLNSLYTSAIMSKMDIYNYEDNIDDAKTVKTNSEETSNTGDYILPNSNTEALERSDLEGLSAEQCKLARNEIYARHGRKFSNSDIQAYFDGKSWYTGTIEPNDFSEDMLSDIEKQNRDFIVAYEKEMGYN